jgi:hypothetical protein
MRADPRVIKWSTLKLGHRPEDMVDSGEQSVDRHKQIEIGLEMSKLLEKQMGNKIMEGM